MAKEQVSWQLPFACAAPPLTDEIIQRYEQLATHTATGAVRDAMNVCLRAVKIWWELPESKRSDGDRLRLQHRSDPSASRSEKTLHLTPLEEEHLKSLDDSIPWPHEIKAMDDLFEGVQAAEVAENKVKLTAWSSAVQEAVMQRTFSPSEILHLKSKERKVLRECLAKMADAGMTSEAQVAPVIAAICPGMTADKFRDHARRRSSVDAAVARIHNGDEPSPVPRPDLKSTILRDAAKHLIWFLNELNLDREPVTKDKL